MEQQENNKKRITAWVSEETLRKCNSGIALDDSRSRSDFVEKAVSFYAGFLAAQIHTDFLAPVIAEVVEGAVSTAENRIAKLLFKIAVELAKLEQMLASINEMDEETLHRLHIRCVNEVKKINGIIKMEDAVKYQRSDE